MWTRICFWCGHVVGSWTAPEPKQPVTIPAGHFWMCACGRLVKGYPRSADIDLHGGKVPRTVTVPTPVYEFYPA